MLSCKWNKNKYYNCHSNVNKSYCKQNDLDSKKLSQSFMMFNKIKKQQGNVLKDVNGEVSQKEYSKRMGYDENSSFCANLGENLNFSQNLNNPACIKALQRECQLSKVNNVCSTFELNSTNNISLRKMVDLKKKIRKPQINHQNKSIYHSKIKLLKKVRKCFVEDLNQSFKSSRIQTTQEQYEQFTIYKDSQVFPGLDNLVLIKNIIPQRLDNDVQTDQEQMQRFKSKIESELCENIQKYLRQKQQNKIQQLGDE